MQPQGTRAQSHSLLTYTTSKKGHSQVPSTNAVELSGLTQARHLEDGWPGSFCGVYLHAV